MFNQELISRLLETSSRETHRLLLQNNFDNINLSLAEEIKNSNYSSWTTEPRKTRNAALALEALFEFLPQDEVRAVAAWARGIADLAEGNPESAVTNLEESARIFFALQQNHQAAQTQVSKLYALALLGRYDEAIETGIKAIEVFTALGDKLYVAKIEHNIGNIYWRRNDYVAARRYFSNARDKIISCGDEPQTIMIEHCLAAIYSLQDDFQAAEAVLQESLQRAEALKMLDTQAKIESNIGNLNLFRGRYHEALQYLEKSRGKYNELQLPHQIALAEMEIGDVYLELNLLTDAAAIYQKNAAAFASLNLKAEQARALLQLGKCLARLGENRAALEHTENAGKLFKEEGNAIGAATINLIKANLHLREKEFNKAKEFALASEKDFARVNSVRNVLLAQFIRGECEKAMKNFAVAQTIFSDCLQNAEQYDLPQIAWAAANSLGLLLLEQDQRQAEKYFLRAVEIIEKLRLPLAADEFRTAFFTDKSAPYLYLAEIYRLQPDNLAKSFLWIEKARAQSLLDLLGENRNAAKDNGIDENWRNKFDRLREELNWFYSRLNRASSEIAIQTADNIAHWQAEINKREREINALVLQMEASRTNKSAQRTEFDLTSLQAKLGNERALIEFTIFNEEIAAFVVTQESFNLIENLGDVAEVQKVLEAVHLQFGTLRFGAAHLEKHLPQLKKRTDLLLNQLYDILISPLESFIKDKHLIFVPFANLHYVPFQALYDGEQYLIETREVSFAPSASILLNLLENETGKFERALTVGFADERVPQVETEVQSLGAILQNADVLLGAEARFENVRQKLESENFSTLHLACHGQFRPENPLFSSLHLADGWTTVREAAKLRLDNALVVLSACETGLNKVAEGEELLGLVRGFLAAGASSIVLSLWTVNDAATADLMINFYRHLQTGESPASALQAAQKVFIAKNAHPYFWSPFILNGRW